MNKETKNRGTTGTTSLNKVPSKSQRRRQRRAAEKSLSEEKTPEGALARVRYHQKQEVAAQGLPPRLKQLVSSFTLPKEIDPIRIGSQYGGDPTAVAKLFAKVNIRPNATGNPGPIGSSDVIGFAFRDALRSFVYSIGLNATDYYSYQATITLSVVKGAEYYPEFSGPMFGDQTTPILPHGDALYPGRLGISDPHRGFLCNDGDTFRLTVAAVAGVSSAAYYVLKKLDGASWNPVSTAFSQQLPVGTGGTLSWTIVQTGYYALSCQVDNSSNLASSVESGGTISIFNTVNTKSSIFGQLALPRIQEVASAVRSYRIPSVSLMFTNTASPLNRQGQTVGIQLPRMTNWTDNLDYEEVANSQKASTINVVNGQYGFLKPTQSSDLDMKIFQTQNGGYDYEEDMAFSILPESDYLLIHAQITTPEGRQGYFTPCHHIEYETISQWFNTREGNLKGGELDAALRVVAKLPQWHENDFHISDLWNGIKSVASDIWNGIKEVGSTIGPYLPMLAPLLI